MLGNQDIVSINSDEGAVKGSRVNELGDTAGSSRSSFADIWDSTSIEVRAEIVFNQDFTSSLESNNIFDSDLVQ